MALTASRTSQGFEKIGVVHEDQVIYVPGDPGDTYTEGDFVVGTVGEGIVDPMADNEGGQVGRVAKTVVCPAATTAMPYCNQDVADGSDYAKCLIPIDISCFAGKEIYLVTFANHYDCTLAAYTAGTPSITLAASPGANDYYNGALVYVYDGPGAGQVNVISDFDHATVVATLHRPFRTAPTAASKVIVLAGEGVASRGIGFFNRCEGKASGTVTTDQGSDDGDFLVLMDFREAATYLKDLMLPVILARYDGLA